MPNLPTLTDDQLRNVADYVVRLIDQGEHERAKHEERWRQSKSDIDNIAIPFIANIIPDAVDLPYNFAQPRQEALSDFVVTSVLTQSPLVTCEDAAELERQENRERTVDFFFRRGAFGERLKTASVASWYANAGIIRLSYGGQDSPLKFDVIEPTKFICVGSGAYQIHESRCVGHCYERSRGELRMGQIQKRYSSKFDVDELQPAAKTNPATRDPNDKDLTAPASADEDMITLWQVYAVLDLTAVAKSEDMESPSVSGKEKRYSIVIEPSTWTILRMDEYTYRNPCYFSFGYKPNPPDGHWNPRSIGADMQGPHRAYNCLSNMAAYGSLMTAIPPLVAQKGSFTRDQRYKAGALINMEAGDLAMPTISFDLAKIQAELARIERIGDSVARINTAGIAQESTQAKTATQSNNEAAGMKAGIGGYLETFTSPIPRMCEHAEEILADTFDEWKALYGANAPVESAGELRSPVRWDVPGKIPNLNPQVVVQNIQTIVGMLDTILKMIAAAPATLDLGISLIQMAGNAMDIPNMDALVKSIQPPQPPPGMPNGSIGPENGQPASMVANPLAMLGMGEAGNGMAPSPGGPMSALGGA